MKKQLSTVLIAILMVSGCSWLPSMSSLNPFAEGAPEAESEAPAEEAAAEIVEETPVEEAPVTEEPKRETQPNAVY